VSLLTHKDIQLVVRAHTSSDVLNILLQEFGGNSDRNTERYHYFSSPFVARYVRFHPVEWHKHIGMRAGLIGCPRHGK